MNIFSLYIQLRNTHSREFREGISDILKRAHIFSRVGTGGLQTHVDKFLGSKDIVGS